MKVLHLTWKETMLPKFNYSFRRKIRGAKRRSGSIRRARRSKGWQSGVRFFPEGEVFSESVAAPESSAPLSTEDYEEGNAEFGNDVPVEAPGTEPVVPPSD